MAFRPDGRLLASGSSDGRIRFWDVATREWVGFVADAHKKKGENERDTVRYVSRLLFSPDGKTLASSGADDKVKLWNVPPYKDAK